MDIEKHILSELKLKGITIKAAYTAIGISKQTFYNYIKSSNPDEGFLTKVKDLFDIDVKKSKKEDVISNYNDDKDKIIKLLESKIKDKDEIIALLKEQITTKSNPSKTSDVANRPI